MTMSTLTEVGVIEVRNEVCFTADLLITVVSNHTAGTLVCPDWFPVNCKINMLCIMSIVDCS